VAGATGPVAGAGVVSVIGMVGPPGGEDPQPVTAGSTVAHRPIATIRAARTRSMLGATIRTR
jgi:hypothetical protein